MSPMETRPPDYGAVGLILVLTIAAVKATNHAVKARAAAKARKETISGLQATREKLRQKLANANNQRRRARLAEEIRTLEVKIQPMERALAAEEALARAAEADAIAANAKIAVDAKQVSAQIEQQAQTQLFWQNQFPLYAGAGAIVVLVGVGLYAASR